MGCRPAAWSSFASRGTRSHAWGGMRSGGEGRGGSIREYGADHSKATRGGRSGRKGDEQRAGIEG